jgi:hypothetical protein
MERYKVHDLDIEGKEGSGRTAELLIGNRFGKMALDWDLGSHTLH